MLAKLFLLFTLTTTLELFLLIELGKLMGLGATLGLILLTGFVGAWLAKREGLRTLARVRRELAEGKIPGDALVDGLCILIAGTLLLTPGVLTDAVGFALLAPPVRIPIKAALRHRFEDAISQGRASGRFTVIDTTAAGTRVQDVVYGEAPQRPAERVPLRPVNERVFVSGDVIDVTDA